MKKIDNKAQLLYVLKTANVFLFHKFPNYDEFPWKMFESHWKQEISFKANFRFHRSFYKKQKKRQIYLVNEQIPSNENQV